jgi:ATP-dependent DNA ligase
VAELRKSTSNSYANVFSRSHADEIAHLNRPDRRENVARGVGSHFDDPDASPGNSIMLPRITPISPAKIAAPFDHEDWVFELKHDGFRAVAYIEDSSCRLISRKQIQYKSFAGCAP